MVPAWARGVLRGAEDLAGGRLAMVVMRCGRRRAAAAQQRRDDDDDGRGKGFGATRVFHSGACLLGSIFLVPWSGLMLAVWARGGAQ